MITKGMPAKVLNIERKWFIKYQFPELWILLTLTIANLIETKLIHDQACFK